MDDLPKVEGPDDILHDIEGSKRLEDRLAGPRWRESTTRGAPAMGRDPAPGIGRRLLAGCEEATLRRYLTLLRFEASLGPVDDFGYLIGPACQVLEAELGRLVFEPARSLAAVLVATLLEDRKSARQAAILDDWAEGRLPTTIGIGSLVLLALRRACGGGEGRVIDFLDSRFSPDYRGLLMTNGPGRGLDLIRGRFRNPACHGTTCFGESEYREFATLAVANRTFSTWDRIGPDPEDPEPGVGLLHHHLRHRRPGPSAPAPIDLIATALGRLLGLVNSGTSPGIRLAHRPGRSPLATRDIRAQATPSQPAYRLGERIVIEFEAGRPCHFALIDIGTSGAVTVLWPNAWRRDSRIEGGRTYAIPGPETPGLDFVLTGRPGLERIVAIATPRSLVLPLGPDEGSPFRALTEGEIGRLADELGGVDDRAVASCEFLVEG